MAGLRDAPDQDSLSAVRFDQGDELRYSLRSLVRYAPWVRRVHVVTDRQRPHWLVERPGELDLVDHREILPEDHLPTFNSHAISGAVHHLDGLSERFLLFNDDVLLGRPVEPEDFFFANGAVKFFTSRSALPAGPVRAEDLPLVAARKHSRDLVEQMTGGRPNFGFKHTPIVLDRTLMADLEENVPEWRRTLASPFRSGDDIVPEWLHHYVGFHRRQAFPAKLDYAYFDIGSAQSMERVRDLIGRARRPATYCVNDVTEGEAGTPRRHVHLRKVLAQLAPRPSPFEAAP